MTNETNTTAVYPPLPEPHAWETIGNMSGVSDFGKLPRQSIQPGVYSHARLFTADQMRAYYDLGRASHAQAAPTARAVQVDSELEQAIKERDEAEDYIDALLDEVLGSDRAEWSSAYGRDEALADVRERITALHAPQVDRAWHRFERAISETPQPPVAEQKPVAWWIPKAEQFCLAKKNGERPFGKAWEPLYAAPSAPAQDDSERLDWLLLHVSGVEFRRIGVHYSGNARRQDIDAAIAQAKESKT